MMAINAQEGDVWSADTMSDCIAKNVPDGWAILVSAIVLLLVGCSHPLELVGEGDIVDQNGSEHGCTLEQFQAEDEACTENLVADDYYVNYRAVPRPGWQFDRWEGPCAPESVPPDCRLDISVDWVWWTITNYPGLAMPATVAIFEEADADGDGYDRPEDCDDDDESINPGAADIDGDGIDQDCNGFEISGEPEVVFDWSADRCEDLDIPDLPARAFRDRDEQVQLIASHFNVRRSIGPDLNHQTHQCDVVMPSDWDEDPASFNDAEWIGAIYTEDGETIYAIVHNEYHGWEHPGQCTASDSFFCWYNGLTLAISTDGGSSYQHPVTPPEHLVASYPEKYAIDAGPYGVFHPSNIVKGADGFYYEFIHVVDPAGSQWSCLMRSDDLADPDSWRFWDGDGFDGRFVNPYTDSFVNAAEHICSPIDFEAINDMNGSFTYNEYLERYMLLGANSDGLVQGFYYSLSENLVDWTPRRLMLRKPPPWDPTNQSNTSFLYPSIIDPDSKSRSFETVGKTGYIYYTRFNDEVQSPLDRDLMRIPVEFFRY